MDQHHIRNFSIIAHIDHGKSTLADRLLEMTGTVEPRRMRKQVLDSMDLERERGITIKSHAIRILYHAEDGQEYVLNLIDTPGHVDFTYEVSRALAACEGAILIVDASQGVQAQTVANALLALDNELVIIPVLNKIDLPAADVDRAAAEVVELLGCDPAEVIPISAKSGANVAAVFKAIIERVPPPSGDPQGELRALVFDSLYDNYNGAVALVRVVDGAVQPREKITFCSHHTEYEIDNLGYLRLDWLPQQQLTAGEVGYIAAHMKDIKSARVGDTVIHAGAKNIQPLPGFYHIKPMVFSGIYPAAAEAYNQLRTALDKLRLNDASLSFEPEQSEALGFGFRCGFLGLLHLEIVRERLSREFDQEIIASTPNVEYRVTLKDGTVQDIANPAKVPISADRESIAEPFVRARIVVPAEYVGTVMTMTTARRAVYLNTEYPTTSRALMIFDIPLSEIIFDFYDKLKSITRGYGSLDYEFLEFREQPLAKLEILLDGEPVDALSAIVPASDAYRLGRERCEILKEAIPRQLYEVVIQAAVGRKPIARETVKPLRKDVIARLYGGDVTRKRKLLEKQKIGKKRMKRIGHVEVPAEAFLSILRIGGK
jgi:GTP-binding protein LepA